MTSSVVTAVSTVRLRVWFTLLLITVSNGAVRITLRFSRMRSNTTMVSLME